MYRTREPRLNCFIGDDLVIRVISKGSVVDLAPYTITSDLRAGSGDGVLVSSFAVVKDTPNGFGKVFGFTATLARTITATTIPDISYAIDYKLVLGGAVQHSERAVIRFDKVVTA